MARRAFQPPYHLLLRQKHSGDLGEKPSIIANTANLIAHASSRNGIIAIDTMVCRVLRIFINP
jgi:hypothetical protein